MSNNNNVFSSFTRTKKGYVFYAQIVELKAFRAGRFPRLGLLKGFQWGTL